jgi:hypothetical protein
MMMQSVIKHASVHLVTDEPLRYNQPVEILRIESGIGHGAWR